MLASAPARGAAALGAGHAGTTCRDASVPATVEEARLGRTLGENPAPVAQQILVRSGFAAQVNAFSSALCRAGSLAAAERVVSTHGTRLWESAVRRAQRGGGGLAADDDRPLYWARLSMTLALRQWRPAFPVSAADRARWKQPLQQWLQQRLEYTSRGITSSRFAPVAGLTRVLVTGFDPFLLDTEIRRGNPSGAVALSLDGRTFSVGGRTVQVQTVVFPVRYADFDRGIVEDALAPHLAAGGQRVDLLATVSQGRPDRFDLEVWNGRRRSVLTGDNLNVWGGGTSTAPVVFPGVSEGPEFVASTLPHASMLAADGQPFPVIRHPAVVEIPAGSDAPTSRPDGPTAGSVAVEGSGGGYLSNEVAYRATLLRDRYAPQVPTGHVHTPVLTMAADNIGEITDPTFEQNRRQIVAQFALISPWRSPTRGRSTAGAA